MENQKYNLSIHHTMLSSVNTVNRIFGVKMSADQALDHSSVNLNQKQSQFILMIIGGCRPWHIGPMSTQKYN